MDSTTIKPVTPVPKRTEVSPVPAASEGEDDEPASPSDPADLLPAQSVLSFEEYLDMQKAIGEPTRFRLLYRLNRDGSMSAKQLREAFELEGSTLHHHLNTLVDVGLVENRKRKEPDSEGLFSYYRATAIGERLLDQGVEQLMRDEHTFQTMYGGDGE